MDISECNTLFNYCIIQPRIRIVYEINLYIINPKRLYCTSLRTIRRMTRLHKQFTK